MSKKLQLLDGLRIAYQEWGQHHAKKVLAVHGWLDNSNSFKYLGPYLADRGFHVVAMDLIGHGHSDHLGVGAFYTIPKAVYVAREFVVNLGWEKNYLIGHSMGASIGVEYTAAFNDKVNKLVLIDGMGPLVQEYDSVAQSLRIAIEAEIKFKKQNKPIKLYKTLKDAVDQRVLAVHDYPGQQFLSRDAARTIVARAVKLVEDKTDREEILDESEGPVMFRHDRRQLLPSYVYSTREQGLAYFRSLHTPTLLVRGESGFPPAVSIDFDERVKILNKKGLFEESVLPGSHHLHLDAESCAKTAEIIHKFLLKDPPKNEAAVAGAPKAKERIG